jgi:hypothetical protein
LLEAAMREIPTKAEINSLRKQKIRLETEQESYLGFQSDCRKIKECLIAQMEGVWAEISKSGFEPHLVKSIKDLSTAFCDYDEKWQLAEDKYLKSKKAYSEFYEKNGHLRDFFQ